MEHAIQYDPDLYRVLDDVHLTLFTRQLAFLLRLKGGMEYQGHHWVWQTRAEWADMFGWNERHITRTIQRGVDAELIVRKQMFDNRRLYRLCFEELQSMYEEAGFAPAEWLSETPTIPATSHVADGAKVARREEPHVARPDEPKVVPPSYRDNNRE